MIMFKSYCAVHIQISEVFQVSKSPMQRLLEALKLANDQCHTTTMARNDLPKFQSATKDVLFVPVPFREKYKEECARGQGRSSRQSPPVLSWFPLQLWKIKFLIRMFKLPKIWCPEFQILLWFRLLPLKLIRRLLLMANKNLLKLLLFKTRGNFLRVPLVTILFVFLPKFFSGLVCFLLIGYLRLFYTHPKVLRAFPRNVFPKVWLKSSLDLSGKNSTSRESVKPKSAPRSHENK